MYSSHMRMEKYAIGGGTGIPPPEIDDMGCDRGKAFIAAVVMLFYKLDMRYCYYSTHLSL